MSRVTRVTCSDTTRRRLPSNTVLYPSLSLSAENAPLTFALQLAYMHRSMALWWNDIIYTWPVHSGA